MTELATVFLTASEKGVAGFQSKMTVFQRKTVIFLLFLPFFIDSVYIKKLDFQPSFIVDFSLLNCDFYHISAIIGQA